MRLFLGFLIAGLFLSGCATLRVQSDYDPDFHMGRLRTFAILENSEEKKRSLTCQRIENALARELASKGYVETSKNKADFFVVFHMDVQSKTDIYTEYHYVGIRPYGWGGGWVPTAHTYSYEEGRLVVDMIEAKSKRLFWQGIATDRLKHLKRPEDRIRYIHKVIHKLLENFPSRPGD